MNTRGYAESGPVLVDDEIELREVLARIWRRRWFIVSVTVALVVMVVSYLHFATYRYTVELKVAPINEQGGKSLGALAESAGALGLDLPTSGRTANIDLYLALLRSKEVAERLMASPNLVQKIFPSDWDAQTQNWRKPHQGFTARAKRTLKEWLGVPQRSWEPPTPRRLLTFLEHAVKVDKSRTSPIVTVAVDHKNAEFAQDLLMHLHNSADAILRERTLDRTSEYINYLQGLLQRTTAAEYRKALVDALMAQEKLRMTAMVDLPFSVDVVSGPVTSASPTSPRPTLLLGMSVVLGIISSMFLVVAWDYLRPLPLIEDCTQRER